MKYLQKLAFFVLLAMVLSCSDQGQDNEIESDLLAYQKIVSATINGADFRKEESLDSLSQTLDRPLKSFYVDLAKAIAFNHFNQGEEAIDWLKKGEDRIAPEREAEGSKVESCLVHLEYSKLYATRQLDFTEAQKHIEEALDLALTLDHPFLLSAVFTQKGIVEGRLGLFEEAEYSHKKSLSHSLKFGLHKSAALAYKNYGNFVFDQNEVSRALSYYDSTIHYAKLAKDTNMLIAGGQNKAICFQQLGQFDSAFNIMLDMTNLAVYSNDQERAFILKYSLANIYLRIKKTKEAIATYQEVIRDPQITWRSDALYGSLYGLATAYLNLDELDSCVKYLDWSQTVLKEEKLQNLPVYLAASYFMRGKVLNMKGQHEAALQTIQKASNMFKENKDMASWGSSKLAMAEIYMNDYHDLQATQEVYDELLSHASSFSDAKMIGYYALALKSHHHLRNDETAVNLFDKYEDLVNARNKVEMAESIAKANAELQITKEKIEREKEVAEEQRKQQRKFIITLALSGFIVFVLLIVLVLIQNRRIQSELSRAKMRHDLTQTELMVLRNQFNPHFIFNVLTSIKATINDQKTQLAANFIDEFAVFLRSILQISKVESLLLEEEISLTKKYLGLEQKIKDVPIELSVNMAPDTEDAMIPPLVLQPLLENAIKHGISDGKPLTIKVEAQMIESEVLQISVDNSGDGSWAVNQVISENSFGVNLVKKKLEMYDKVYGTQSSLQFYDLASLSDTSGTRALITIQFV